MWHESMKIAILVHKLTQGGTQRQALSLGRELIKNGHAVTVYAAVYTPEVFAPELTKGIPIHALRIVTPGQKEKPGRPFAWLNRPRILVAFLRERSASRALADLIDPATEILNPHAHGYMAAYFFKRRVRDVPSVWMMNDMPLSSWALWKERQLGETQKRTILSRVLLAAVDLLKRKYIAAQQVIAVLDDINRGYVRAYLDRDAVVVRSGLDGERFSCFPHEAPLNTDVRLLLVGIFEPHRRFEDAVAALRLLRERGMGATLSVIGNPNANPSYYKKILAQIAEAGCKDYVVLKGGVSESELVEAYRTHHIFLFPNDIQTWGLAVFEAMAMGMPVIVSRGCGAHEVLTDRINALLVEPQQPTEIADAVEELVADHSLYDALRNEGRRFVESSISWQRYADRMSALFTAAVAHRET